MTNVRETRRADELKPGDWLADDEDGNANPNEVMAAFQYPTARGNRVHLTTRVPGLNPCSCGDLEPNAEFELITSDELAGLRESAERAQKIADIRALADWLEENPWLPVADLDANRHLYGPDGYRTVVETAKRLGAELDTHLDDRTKFTYRRGPLTYSVLAWHDGGRPAEPATDTDPTGLAYTRADDEPDDPTPVSGARVPAHTGGVTEGGLAEEVIRYFSFGHGQTDPADDSGKDLVCHYVTVIAPTAEACREAMLGSRFGREWAFEYVPGTPQANEWIPRWTEYERIDAMPKPETAAGIDWHECEYPATCLRENGHQMPEPTRGDE